MPIVKIQVLGTGEDISFNGHLTEIARVLRAAGLSLVVPPEPNQLWYDRGFKGALHEVRILEVAEVNGEKVRCREAFYEEIGTKATFLREGECVISQEEFGSGRYVVSSFKKQAGASS